jgi:hypothetical protein
LGGGDAAGRLGAGASAASPVLRQPGDHGVHLHIFGALVHQDLGHHAFVHGLDFHGRLVGLDLGNDIAGFTLSPTLMSHFDRVPASIVGLSAGIVISMAMGFLGYIV